MTRAEAVRLWGRHLDALETARAAVDEAESRLRREVAAARGAGLSWADIAQPLRIDRETASRRYARYVDMAARVSDE
jgi:hypothetical protein